MTTSNDALAAAAARMRELLADMADELAGATEGSPEMARLERIADAIDAYDAATGADR